MRKESRNRIMETTGKTLCKNCETNFEGNFCPECGQSAGVKHITFKDTLADFSDTIFSIDAPLFYTMLSLFKNPGRMLREFLAGKRKTYYKPVAFFVLMTIFYLIIRDIIGYDPLIASAIQIDDSGNSVLGDARTFMFLNINKLLFLFVFWLGILLKIFFYKQYSLAEFWTIAFYLGGFYIIFTTINMFFVQWVSSKFQFFAMISIGFYFLYVFISLFKKPVWLIVLKAIPIYGLAFVLYIFSAFSLSYLIVSIF